MLRGRGIDEPPCAGNRREVVQPELASLRGQTYPQVRTKAEFWQSIAACYVFAANPTVGVSIDYRRERLQVATCHK